MAVFRCDFDRHILVNKQPLNAVLARWALAHAGFGRFDRHKAGHGQGSDILQEGLPVASCQSSALGHAPGDFSFPGAVFSDMITEEMS